MTDKTDAPNYVTAAGNPRFTALYDTAMALTMRESAWRPRLTAAVTKQLPANAAIVDIGCGTATQTIAIAQARPDAHLIGIDGDPEVLTLAANKITAANIELKTALAHDLPIDNQTADRAILTLLLHHLDPDAKVAALKEAKRILKPDGLLHVIDWGPPTGLFPRLGFAALQQLDGRTNTRDHATGHWLTAFTHAGLTSPQPLHRLPTAWGTLEHRISTPTVLHSRR